MSNESVYEKRGVSSAKEDVHKALINIDKGIFHNAFCKILSDVTSNNKDFCTIMHADGAGTKSSLAYMYWRETNDISVWKGIAQDSIVMNTDDLMCCGVFSGFIVSSTIGRNKKLIPGEIISAIINGTEEFLSELRDLGIEIYSAGGETADIGDLVRTIVLDSTIFCRAKRSEILSVNIQPNDVIVGLSSSGKATYEKEFNSGIGSNGLTSARHDLFSNVYAEKYPECYDNIIDKNLIFRGKYLLSDIIEPHKVTAGKFALSPTRTYLPVVKNIVQNIGKEIHAMIHCSGGGQTKVMNFVNNLHIIKNNLFDVPLIFELIKHESNTPYIDMFKVFNMGHRLEIYLPEKFANEIINISQHFDIEAKIIGRCEFSEKKRLTIKTKDIEIVY